MLSRTPIQDIRISVLWLLLIVVTGRIDVQHHSPYQLQGRSVDAPLAFSRSGRDSCDRGRDLVFSQITLLVIASLIFRTALYFNSRRSVRHRMASRHA